MKKLTAIIIIVLPVFLLISISLAGRIVNTLNPIRVESVAFIDRNGTVINRTDTDTAPKITISVGQTINFVSNLDQYRDYSVRVLPSGASNQGVLFSSQHLGERLEFVTENQIERQASQRGHFRAIRAGTAIITMRSDCDSRISAQITIRILSVLDSVQIEWTPTELFVGDQVWLDYSTSPAFEAGRIRHQWSSSHPSLVSIDNFGRLIVLKYDEDVPQIVITLSVVEVLVVDVFIPVLDVYDTVDITISSQMPILAFLPPP
ncbi:MAG: hypothetical protein FWD86_03900, partial [Firmicutes bacterium]|nr:hypothetical protein [Bacillota bacterium]